MTLIKVKSRGTDNVSGRKNILINGGFQIAQRATSVASSDNSNEGYHTVDRWSFRWNNAISGAATLSQSTDTPDGFANSFKVDVTTANNSMRSSTSDWLYLYQPIEGQNVQQLAYGTSSAKTVTLSFYAKRVGTWGQSQNISVGLQTEDGTNEYINASVATQTTWTRHVVTFVGSTSATIDNDNGHGMGVYFSLAGSQSGTFTGAASTSWSTTRQDFDNQIGNLLSNTANEFYITGVQLEIGDTATEFEHRSFAEELTLCKRYYQVIVHGSGDRVGTGGYYSSSGVQFPIRFNPVMRASPTIVTVTGSNYWTINGNGNDYLNSVTLDNATTRSMSVYNNSEASGTAGYHGILVTGNANSYLHATAEL